MVYKGKKVTVKDDRFVEFHLDTSYGNMETRRASVSKDLLADGFRAIKNLNKSKTIRALYKPEVRFRAIVGGCKMSIYKRGYHIVIMVEHSYKGELHRHRFDYTEVLEAMLEVNNEAGI